MFKAGDQVVCIDASSRVLLANGQTYTIRENQVGNIIKIEGFFDGFFARRFELYKEPVAYPTLRRDYV